MEGWPDWVDLVRTGWLHIKMVYLPQMVNHPGTNRNKHRVTSLINTTKSTGMLTVEVWVFCVDCSYSVPVQCRLALTSNSVSSIVTTWQLGPVMLVSALKCRRHVTQLLAVLCHPDCCQQTSVSLDLESACRHSMLVWIHPSYLRRSLQAIILSANQCQVLQHVTLIHRIATKGKN